MVPRYFNGAILTTEASRLCYKLSRGRVAARRGHEGKVSEIGPMADGDDVVSAAVTAAPHLALETRFHFFGVVFRFRGAFAVIVFAEIRRSRAVPGGDVNLLLRGARARTLRGAIEGFH